jgi:hypothetical protein
MEILPSRFIIFSLIVYKKALALPSAPDSAECGHYRPTIRTSIKFLDEFWQAKCLAAGGGYTVSCPAQ